MKEQHYIAKSVVVQDNTIFLNGKMLFTTSVSGFLPFAKQAFQNLQIDYPKFYKMDALSKLAFLSAEYLLQNKAQKEDIALVLANASGSLDTDVKHQKSIQDKDHFYPSPATFVYTLANICAGEIAIRHQLQTEQAFFVFDRYPSDLMKNYADYLLDSQKATQVVCGWVEYFQEKYKAVLYLVGQVGETAHTETHINELFK